MSEVFEFKGKYNDKYYIDFQENVTVIDDNGGFDKLIFAENISRDNIDIVGATNGKDILLINNLNNHVVIIKGHYKKGHIIEQMIFDNDDQIYSLEVGALYRGTKKNETITGSKYDDIFIQSKGNDTLKGGSGEDVYKLDLSLGNVKICEKLTKNQIDVIELNSENYDTKFKVVYKDDLIIYKYGDLEIYRDGYSSKMQDLYIKDIKTGKKVVIEDQFYEQEKGKFAVEKLILNGEEIDLRQIQAKLHETHVYVVPSYYYTSHLPNEEDNSFYKNDVIQDDYIF